MGTIEGGLHVLLLGRGVRFLRSGKESFRSIDVDRSGFHWISNDRRILRFRTDDSGNPVQAAEVRGDAFIAYALGNFVFDQRWTPEHTQGYLLEATFWGKQLANVRLVPYQIADQYRPEFVTGATRAKILRDVFEAAKGLPVEP